MQRIQSIAPEVKVMSDDEINELIPSLNDKQREVFNVVNSWARKTVTNYSTEDPIGIEPLQLFITGGARTGKSHLIKTIDAALNKMFDNKSQKSLIQLKFSKWAQLVSVVLILMLIQSIHH